MLGKKESTGSWAELNNELNQMLFEIAKVHENLDKIEKEIGELEELLRPLS